MKLLSKAFNTEAPELDADTSDEDGGGDGDHDPPEFLGRFSCRLNGSWRQGLFVPRWGAFDGGEVLTAGVDSASFA